MSGLRTLTRIRDGMELATFAARWQPYGGPADADILIHFGLTPDRYHLRLGHILDFYSGDRLGLTHAMHSALRQHCWEQIT